jgi:hypothetical protein
MALSSQSLSRWYRLNRFKWSSTNPVFSWLGSVLSLTLSLVIALVFLMSVPALMGGTIFGLHLPVPSVLMTVCS